MALGGSRWRHVPTAAFGRTFGPDCDTDVATPSSYVDEPAVPAPLDAHAALPAAGDGIMTAPSVAASPPWTFLTNRALVLSCIARDPQARLRDVSARVGITERTVQRIVADLVAAGHLTRRRVGRRNSYEVSTHRPSDATADDRSKAAVLWLLLGPATMARRT